MKNGKKVMFAVTSANIPILFKGKNIFISEFETKNDSIDSYKDVFLKDARNFKWLATNIFTVETDEYIYYVVTKKESKLNKFLAFSKTIPKEGIMLHCTRLLYNYGACWEDEIITSPVKKIQKISEDLYKVTTRHEYFVKRVE